MFKYSSYLLLDDCFLGFLDDDLLLEEFSDLEKTYFTKKTYSKKI